VKHERRLVRNLVHHALLQAAEANPSPFERQEADIAARKACQQLGLPPDTASVRFYSPFHPASPLAPGVLGSTDPYKGRTVWVRAGQALGELRASVRHECGHVAQIVAGEQPNHDGYGDGPGWPACRVERFALGDHKARKELRRAVRLAIQSATTVADVQTFLDTQKGTPA
jgi:hypothetical protein